MANNGNIDNGYITLGGAHTIAVEQVGKQKVTRKDGTVVYVPFHEYAYVQASARSYYNPRMAEIISDQIARQAERAQRWMNAAHSDTEKWCSECDMWMSKRGFSPKAGTFDGLHPHCKTCRNNHARRLYALQREAAGQSVRGYKRKQADVIEVDFGGGAVEKAA